MSFLIIGQGSVTLTLPDIARPRNCFCGDPEATAGERDTLVLPILFLFRHYLSFALRALFVYGHVLSGQKATWRHSHDLGTLWAEVLSVR